MYVRCRDCLRTTRVLDEVRSACPACDASWPSVVRVRGLGRQERFRTADSLARTWRIDLACAYSVLFGIMTLEEAIAFSRGAGQPAVAASSSPLPVAAGSSPQPHGVDPAFRPAIESGHLMERQALERGDRITYASRLAQEFQLSMHDAFLVADNRISLRAALDLKKEKPVAAPSRKEEAAARSVEPDVSRRSDVPAIVVVVGFLLLASVWSIVRAPGREAGVPALASAHPTRSLTRLRTPVIEASVEFQTDVVGHLTEVAGSDPQTVLAAFCERTWGREEIAKRPVGVEGAGDARVGLYREGPLLKSITIRRAGGRWVTGNGLQPIEGVPYVPTTAPSSSP